MTKYQSVTNDYSWAMVVEAGGYVRFALYESAQAQRAIDTVSPLIVVDVWQHVAATFDLATQETKIYVNGVAVPTQFVPGHSSSIAAIQNSVSPVRIGTFLNANGNLINFWDGLIDEVGLFDRALSAAEVQAIYEAGPEGFCPEPEPTPSPTATAEPSPTPSPTATAEPSPTASATIGPPEVCTLTVNDGAIFSGSRSVTLTGEAKHAAYMMLSNDGGFVGSIWQPYQPSTQWTLRDPGFGPSPYIVTLSVYAYFADASWNVLCGGSISDDIIYDSLPPGLEVKLSQPGSSATTLQAAHEVLLSLTATDQQGGSGVADMQISTQSDFAGAVWQAFTPNVSIAAAPGETIHVRVRDVVGNSSPTAQVRVSYQLYLPLLV